MTTVNGTIQAPDMAALIAERDRLLAENAALQARGKRKLGLKVSETTGVVSVYGLQRFPVSLQVEQWAILADFMPEVLAFGKANAATIQRIRANNNGVEK